MSSAITFDGDALNALRRVAASIQVGDHDILGGEWAWLGATRDPELVAAVKTLKRELGFRDDGRTRDPLADAWRLPKR